MHKAGENFRESRLDELQRIHLLGTGVKIVSATAHSHGFGVARQGPWVTWVNTAQLRSSGRSESKVIFFEPTTACPQTRRMLVQGMT
jgi:hypothetical protein